MVCRIAEGCPTRVTGTRRGTLRQVVPDQAQAVAFIQFLVNVSASIWV